MAALAELVHSGVGRLHNLESQLSRLFRRTKPSTLPGPAWESPNLPVLLAKLDRIESDRQTYVDQLASFSSFDVETFSGDELDQNFAEPVLKKLASIPVPESIDRDLLLNPRYLDHMVHADAIPTRDVVKEADYLITWSRFRRRTRSAHISLSDTEQVEDAFRKYIGGELMIHLHFLKGAEALVERPVYPQYSKEYKIARDYRRREMDRLRNAEVVLARVRSEQPRFKAGSTLLYSREAAPVV